MRKNFAMLPKIKPLMEGLVLFRNTITNEDGFDVVKPDKVYIRGVIAGPKRFDFSFSGIQYESSLRFLYTDPKYGIKATDEIEDGDSIKYTVTSILVYGDTAVCILGVISNDVPGTSQNPV